MSAEEKLIECLLDYWKLNYYLLEDNCHILEGNNTIPKTFKEFEEKVKRDPMFRVFCITDLPMFLREFPAEPWYEIDHFDYDSPVTSKVPSGHVYWAFKDGKFLVDYKTGETWEAKEEEKTITIKVYEKI